MTTISRGGHVLGWRRDTHPARLPFYAVSRKVLANIPNKSDLREQGLPVYDQGPIGSCTGNALAACTEFVLIKQNPATAFQPSRLFIYYNERYLERSIPSDSGAMISDGVRTLQQWGVCPEELWPYDPEPADETTGLFPAGSPPVTRPPDAAYTAAGKHQEVAGWRVQQTLAQLRGCLAEGYPVAFGFSLYASFYDENDVPRSVIPMPSANDTIEGGHAVCLFGHDDDRKMFLVRNSWGPNNQDDGYFWMPYSYVTEPDLASDFNTIRKVEEDT